MWNALLAISQNIRLLIVGPILVAAAVVWAFSLSTPRFSSEAILVLPTTSPVGQAAGVMKSLAVVDQVLLALNPSSSPEDSARNALVASIKTSVTKDGLLRVEVTAVTALEAQRVANLLIDAWLRTTKPGPQAQVELERRLAHAQHNISTPQAILASQKNALLSLAGLGDLLDRYFFQTLDIERQMKGLTRDVVVQAPTLSSGPTGPSYVIIFLMVMFGAELFFLIWVLGRHALVTVSASPETAQKFEKLRGSLRIFGEKNMSA